MTKFTVGRGIIGVFRMSPYAYFKLSMRLNSGNFEDASINGKHMALHI